MKRIWLFWVVGLLFSACHHQKQWQLVWEEDFNAERLDTSVWSMISPEEFERPTSVSY